ncbi:MAG: DUF721 domain-containing protein [Treponema sp.]|nr:DUF721 domain-containing protein [Treponema sp.]
MKTAGDILSVLFDEGFVKKAQGYSKLFDSWTDITEKNGIAAAADHSRIKDLDKGILQIEMDHPGWKQILQTKQSKILNDFRYRFPELNISGISLMLSRNEFSNEMQAEEAAQTVEKILFAEPFPQVKTNTFEKPAVSGFEAITDNDFKEKLKNLGQTIADRETKGN